MMGMPGIQEGQMGEMVGMPQQPMIGMPQQLI